MLQRGAQSASPPFTNALIRPCQTRSGGGGIPVPP